MTTRSLSIRETHRYVGTYQHLDRWRQIGTVQEIGQEDTTDPEDDDITEPHQNKVYAIVKPEEGNDDTVIQRALLDEYTSWGCAHEYDCCGCRSFLATSAKRVTGDLWCVEITSSRNY